MPARPPFAVPTNYDTKLSPIRELLFRSWVDQNHVPFNPTTPGPTDYDMRGYWQGLQQGNPQAAPSSINANDGQLHYPDYYKTPLHQTFSNESQWAAPSAPQWINDSQLATQGGRIAYDEKNPPQGLLSGLYGLLGGNR